MHVQERSTVVQAGWDGWDQDSYGGDFLRRWIQLPLIDKELESLSGRMSQVFLDYFFERSDLADSLKGVYDIEHLASRVCLKE